MRIGLVRHFRVNHEKPSFYMTSKQFEDWVRHYDESEIFHMDKKEAEIDWDICFSSDLPRAVHTAEKIASCSIEENPLLREIPLAPFIKTKRKLPLSIWNLAGRLAWHFSHPSHPESRKDTIKRANEFIASLAEEEQKNILVVSHGFFLYVLAKELEKQGYAGPGKRRFKNGELYIYEKEHSH
ncbi:phosphoglycerate mutase family protein [Bacillus freudenreichii]|nr:phosphoglycerate mutase family protein [Bacillus freudenreichii]